MSVPPFHFRRGSGPLIVSIPHDGREVPADIAANMSAVGRTLPDTDWHVRRLYAFTGALNVSVLEACWSRYVIDLNRPADDSALYANQVSTGLCPAKTFDQAPVYVDGGEVDDRERRRRVEAYWRPYHDCLARELDRIREQNGFALLWDAHSIRSSVPALFDGDLPELNLGTNGGASCAPEITDALASLMNTSPYSSVTNGRFTGGYITRRYGCPDRRIHAIQMEIAQRSYMDEKTLRYDVSRGRTLGRTLEGLLRTCIEVAQALYR